MARSLSRLFRFIGQCGLVGSFVVAACSTDNGQGSTATDTTTSSSQGGAGGASVSTGATGGNPACQGSAGTSLDKDNLVELKHDDGSPESHLRLENIEITTTQTWVFNDIPIHEAVRFELKHPAKIHGFEVMWAGVEPAGDPQQQLVAGLYGDFGYNGFDFWEKDPLWTGSRCAAEVDPKGEFLTYAFEKPIAIEHPGLVYVAHRAEPNSPVFWWDETEKAGPDGCVSFDDCSSSFNLPEADSNQYYNGVTIPYQRQFMVRLYVEYTDNVDAKDTFFQPVPNAPPGNPHVAFGDYDNDGYDDLLLAGDQLWHNQGDGTFVDVSVAAGLQQKVTTGGVFGDYDNDGCLDLFLFRESYSQPDFLMHSNCDGTFSDVTLAAGIDDSQSYNDCGDPKNIHAPTAAAAWVDIDADGFLDLYVANFICWDKASHYVDNIWRNKGDGTFENLTSKQGFGVVASPSRGVAPIDHDGDGDIDIFVNNYRLKRNLFFDNNGDGSFTERAQSSGLAGHLDGLYYGHTIGTAWGDLDNDGDFDVVSANLAHPRFFDFSDKTEILLNDGNGNFTDNGGNWDSPTSLNGLRYQETHSVPLLADIDNNGTLDLAISCIYDGRPSDFYWGNGDGTFVLDAYHAGITTENGWGMAASDFDNDGDVDIFSQGLFKNNFANQGHWLQVRAVGGITANWAAIGATVKILADGKTYLRHVQGGTGKGGQDSLYLHYGIGDATSVSSIEVTYPGGKQVSYNQSVAADQRVWFYEDGSIHLGWGPKP
jgi:hypothetical protein